MHILRNIPCISGIYALLYVHMDVFLGEFCIWVIEEDFGLDYGMSNRDV